MRGIYTVLFAFSLCTGLFTIAGCETSHSESDKPNLLGGHTHEETTTTKNPITGDTSTSHSEQKTD